jgi:hypothetical protein
MLATNDCDHLIAKTVDTVHVEWWEKNWKNQPAGHPSNSKNDIVKWL